jgi:hypothetical protein
MRYLAAADDVNIFPNAKRPGHLLSLETTIHNDLMAQAGSRGVASTF